MSINIGETGRNKADLAILNSLNGRLSQRFHLNKPLWGNQRLHGSTAAIALADRVSKISDILQEPQGAEFFHDLFAAFQRIHPLIFAGIGIHFTIFADNSDLLQMVPQPDLEVVGVMCRGDLDRTGTKLHIAIFIGDNRDFFIDNRQHDHLADFIFITLIIRMNRYCGIAQHRFRTGSGYHQITAAVSIRIAQMPQMAFMLFMLHLDI